MEKIHCNKSNSEIDQSEWETIETRMKDRNFSSQGFLDQDENLAELMKLDSSNLERLGITFEQIADCLETITEKFYRLKYTHRNDINYDPWSTIVVDNRYIVHRTSYMGAQKCPFKNKALDDAYHGYEYGDTDFEIDDPITGLQLVFNNLHIHMCRQHHFLESKKCYRLEPEIVIKMFDLKPGVSYKPDYPKYQKWIMKGGISVVEQRRMELIRHLALKIYNPKPGVTLMLFPPNSNLIWTGIHTECVDQVYIESKKENWDWATTSSKVMLAINNNWIKEGHPTYSKSAEKITEQVKKELELINLYKETGDFKGLKLISFSENYCTVEIEGIECDVSSGSYSYNWREYEYLPVTENQIDQANIKTYTKVKRHVWSTEVDSSQLELLERMALKIHNPESNVNLMLLPSVTYFNFEEITSNLKSIFDSNNAGLDWLSNRIIFYLAVNEYYRNKKFYYSDGQLTDHHTDLSIDYESIYDVLKSNPMNSNLTQLAQKSTLMDNFGKIISFILGSDSNDKQNDPETIELTFKIFQLKVKSLFQISDIEKDLAQLQLSEKNMYDLLTECRAINKNCSMHFKKELDLKEAYEKTGCLNDFTIFYFSDKNCTVQLENLNFNVMKGSGCFGLENYNFQLGNFNFNTKPRYIFSGNLEYST